LNAPQAPDNLVAMLDIRADGSDVVLAVKAVPGATRTRVAGLLGDRLKITVAAPPEKGKANDAICELLGRLCGVSAKAITVERGLTNPLKTVRIAGVTLAQVRQALSV